MAPQRKDSRTDELPPKTQTFLISLTKEENRPGDIGDEDIRRSTEDLRDYGSLVSTVVT